MEKVPGLINGISSYSGEDIANVARQMFGKNIESISTEQLALISDYLVPSQYLLRNHRIKNGRQKFTFDIPGYGDGDPRKAFSHRPWQRDIVNDQSRNLVIEKSRQLGMSEIAVASMLWWADSHSSYGVKCLYAFPKRKWGF